MKLLIILFRYVYYSINILKVTGKGCLKASISLCSRSFHIKNTAEHCRFSTKRINEDKRINCIQILDVIHPKLCIHRIAHRGREAPKGAVAFSPALCENALGHGTGHGARRKSQFIIIFGLRRSYERGDGQTKTLKNQRFLSEDFTPNSWCAVFLLS